MSRGLYRFGLAVVLGLASNVIAMAQLGGGGGFGGGEGSGSTENEPVKLTGPAAKKADDVIKGYTARIEKDIEQDRQEIKRLRAELHELIDIRSEMGEAIIGLRGELASRGVYAANPPSQWQQQPAPEKPAEPARAQAQGAGAYRRDLIYGLGSALPKEPTPEQREQIRRLAPRADLKRTIEKLRVEVEETQAEVDQLAYRLLELRSGNPALRGVGGMGGLGMGGMGGGMGGMMRGVGMPWFGSMEVNPMGGMGGGMR